MNSDDPAVRFWRAINDYDLDAAFAVVAEDARVTLDAAGVQGGRAEARAWFDATARAFPDVRFTVRRSFTGTDGTHVAEVTMEGTQAADYLGVINQEKHVDVEGAWRLGVADGRVVSIRGFWDANQLYRRLGVKRLDQIALV